MTAAALNITNTSGYLPPRFTDVLALGIFLIPVSVIGTCGGFFCIIILARKDAKSRTQADGLFISLSVDSLAISALVIPLQAYTSIVGPVNILASQAFAPLCRCNAFMFIFFITASEFCHLAVALNRFSVVVLSHYPFFRRGGAMKVLLFTPWFLAFWFAIWPLFHIGGEYGFNARLSRCSTLSTTSVSFSLFLRMPPLVCLPMMVLCYIAVYSKVMASRRKLGHHRASVTVQASASATPAVKTDGATLSTAIKSKRGRKKLEMHVTKVSLVTCVFYVLMYLPMSAHSMTTKTAANLRSPTVSYLLMLSWIGKCRGNSRACCGTPWLSVSPLDRKSSWMSLKNRQGSCCGSRQLQPAVG